MSQIAQAIKLKSFKLSGIWLPTLFVLATGTVLVMMVFAMLGYQLLYLNRIYPGVMVDGVGMGGMTPNKAMASISEGTAQALDRPITIRAEGKSWTLTGQELGMWLDVKATADKAYGVGRQGNLLADMLVHLMLLVAPRNVEPVIRYDTGPLNGALGRLAEEINQPPQNAELVVQPDATIERTPALRGRRLHAEATRAAIEAAILNKSDRPVPAVVQQVIPAITDADIEVAHQQARNLLSQPLVFGFKTETDEAEWSLKPETLAGMIALVDTTGDGGKTQLALTFEPDTFAGYFEQFAKTINIEPSEARFEFDPETEELTVLQHSRQGRRLDMEAAYRQLETLPETLKEKPVQFVELPVTLLSPAVSSKEPDSLGITGPVSESTSYFKGSSEGRMHNIALSASKFHGVVIPPDEVFSFNRYLGEVTKENGFDESLIIFGDRTTVGIGGGVCQVSTTVFRTAFFGGFEIVERWAHGYRVGWYETNSGPGLDATIYTPDVDFKFRNDTGQHLLIQTETDLEAGTVTFRFYGTPTDREVIVSEPEITDTIKHGPPVYEKDPTLPRGTVKQIDWAKDGLDVTVTRIVQEGETILHEDIITSQYRPWRAVYKVGTGGESAERARQ